MKNAGKQAARALLWAVTAVSAAGVFWWYAADRTPLPVQPMGPAGTVQPAPVLDVNAATAAQLEQLPGIGPALAERIVAYREERGPFAGPEALQEVSGIGPATWEGVAPYVYFGEEEPQHEDTGGG